MNFNACEWLIYIRSDLYHHHHHQHNSNNNRHSRVRAVLFVVGHSQIVALHHKDVELSQLLDEVHCKLDASLDFNVIDVCMVDAANAATNLLVCKRTKTKQSFLVDLLVQYSTYCIQNK